MSLNFKSCCFHCFKLKPGYNETPLYRTTVFYSVPSERVLLFLRENVCLPTKSAILNFCPCARTIVLKSEMSKEQIVVFSKNSGVKSTICKLYSQENVENCGKSNKFTAVQAAGGEGTVSRISCTEGIREMFCQCQFQQWISWFIWDLSTISYTV